MWKKSNKLIMICLLSSIVLLIFGTFYIWYVWNENVKIASEQALKIATNVETAFPMEMLDKMDINITDVEKPEYQYIKNKLIDIVKVDKSVRFVYLYTLRGDKIYFIADSEPADSVDYSPPGQEYTEADKLCFQPFVDGQSVVTPPTTDRWGTWVSIFVPVKDSESGAVKAVLGMDYPAQNWNKEALFITAQAVVIVLFLFLLCLTIFVVINKGYKAKESLEKFNKFFYSNPIPLAITQISKKKFVDVNQAFTDKLEYTKNEVIGKTSEDLVIFIEPEKQIIASRELMKNGSMHNVELKIKTKSGKIIDGLFSGELIESEGEKYFLTAMVDQTEHKKYETDILKKNEELEKLNRIMIDREVRMAELKKEMEKK